MDTPNTFTARFRWLMAVADLRQSAVARLTNLSPKTVEFFSSGRRSNPTAETARAVARAFGVSLDWLLAGEGELPDQTRVRLAVASIIDPASIAPDVPEAIEPVVDRSGEYVQPSPGEV